MRRPKQHINYQRRQQFWLTVAFALLLFSLIAMLAGGCAPKDTTRTFSRPKYEVSTHHTTRNGRAAVRQKWHKRWWFWQQDRRNSTDPAP